MDQKKLDYMIQVNRQIRNGLSALNSSTRRDRKERRTFSSYYSVLNALNIAENVEFTLEKYHITDYSGFEGMLEPNFQFSENPELFSVEFKAVLLLFAGAGRDGDPRVDLLAMKALFAAGAMVAKLEREGKKRSDIPAKAGRSPRKNYISEQVYFNLFYSKIEGKSRHDICEQIRKKALKQEEERARKKGEIPKKVLSVRRIGEKLKEVLDKYFR